MATIAAVGAREILEWYDADASRRVFDDKFERLCDTIILAQRAAYPKAREAR
jgi:hypothetical protein